MRLLLFITLSVVFIISNVSSHTYHLGSCPVVTPKPDFNMDSMLGKWYVVRKTSTSSKCLVYNFTKTDEPYQYKIEQVSDHPILGLLSVDNKYHYTGILTVPHRAVPADMIVRFPLSVAGSASYTVFDTDYRNYAAIFTCQKLPLSHRQSVSVLSRTKTIDSTILEEIRNKLDSFGISPYDLSIIDQSGCKSETDGVQINIDDQTLSSKNIGNVVRKAGEKVGDGVEFVLEGTRKVYNSATNKNNNDDRNDKREEIIENQQQNEVEWLP